MGYQRYMEQNRIQDFVESLPGYHYNDDGSSTSLPTIQIKHKDTHIAFSPDFLLNNRFSFNYKGFEAALQSQFVSKQYMTNAEVEELTLDKYLSATSIWRTASVPRKY